MTKLKAIVSILLVAACFLSVSNHCFAASLKKVIAVSRFENKTNYSGQINLGDGMADQLADALMQSGKFVVVERQTLEDVIAEQDLAASGRFAKAKSAATGKLVPAQILIKGTITEFEAQSRQGGTGISFQGISLGSSKASAHVGLILRIIDTTTGQILDSVRIEEKAEAGGMRIGLNIKGVSFGTEDFKKTPLGKAVQIAIDKAVVQIAEKLDNLAFEGRIVKVDGGLIYTNIGLRNGASVGDTFTVYALGEELVDPETGELLGSEKTKVGSIKLTSVQEKFSKAQAEVGGGFERGMVLVE
jgi:curli biogenesis system outer membrane secretion channel CsgG